MSGLQSIDGGAGHLHCFAKPLKAEATSLAEASCTTRSAKAFASLAKASIFLRNFACSVQTRSCAVVLSVKPRVRKTASPACEVDGKNSLARQTSRVGDLSLEQQRHRLQRCLCLLHQGAKLHDGMPALRRPRWEQQAPPPSFRKKQPKGKQRTKLMSQPPCLEMSRRLLGVLFFDLVRFHRAISPLTTASSLPGKALKARAFSLLQRKAQESASF